ncbi:MAG: toll/interleukin-1 receptor domain-containing protein [Actinobacteria bacterium]|nr:toll/interleukin-1 receptor domain-containing protein [Actinomycetota bacterium]
MPASCRAGDCGELGGSRRPWRGRVSVLLTSTRCGCSGPTRWANRVFRRCRTTLPSVLDWGRQASRSVERSDWTRTLRVFISWSGERSKGLAIAFRDWLPLVLHYVEPWLSEADIEGGERWAQSVAKELAASNFGIVCATSENVNSPWVLFEAGALTKSLETSRVIPLLLDLEFSDISGPLAQFQAKKLTRSGIGEVIHSLQASADHPVPEERAKQLFEALWPEFEKRLGEIPDRAPTERHVRPQHEVLEELVASVRALDGRIRESEAMIADLPRSRRGSRGLRMHPMMLREIEHLVADGPDDPIGILVLVSPFA